MARQKSTDRIQSLEDKQRELLQQLRAARAAAVKQQRQDAERRAYLIGKAALACLTRDELTNLVEVGIVGLVKSKADLALFDEWLKTPAAIALPATASGQELRQAGRCREG